MPGKPKKSRNCIYQRKSWIVVEILEPPLGGRKQQDYFMSDEIRSKEFKFKIRSVASEPEKSVSSGAAGTSGAGTSGVGTSGAGTSGAGTSGTAFSGEFFKKPDWMNEIFYNAMITKNKNIKNSLDKSSIVNVKFDDDDDDEGVEISTEDLAQNVPIYFVMMDTNTV